MWVLRNYLSQLNTVEAMQEVIKQMDNTLNNEEMLLSMGDFK
jgi:transcription termination factor Rho